MVKGLVQNGYWTEEDYLLMYDRFTAQLTFTDLTSGYIMRSNWDSKLTRFGVCVCVCDLSSFLQHIW